MDRKTAAQEIRTRISCKDYLEKSKSGMYCCPFCGSGTGPNGTGALKLYDTNTFTCHACNRSGDVIDLYRQTTGADYSRAIKELAQEIGIYIDGPHRSSAAEDFADRNGANLNGRPQGDIEAPPERKTAQRAAETPTEATADYTAYYDACTERLDSKEGEAGREYLKRRGVLGPALFYGAGFDPVADPANAPGAMGEAYRPHPNPRIILPCSPGHYVARSIDPATEKQYAKMNPARSHGAAAPAIWNEKALFAQEVQEIFVVEGVFDALSIIEAGAEAIALNSANNGRALIEKLEKTPTAATLILCPDNDQDERTRAKTQAHFDKIAEGLTRLHTPFLSADINNGCKDANEALCADYYAFRDAVMQAREDARAHRAAEREAAQREERERQQRTGAGMIEDFLQTVKSRKYEPTPTGITDIDRAIGGGFLRQQLILLGAAPGAGKTSLAQWIFEGMAKHGKPCLYLNLEMSRDQMLARSLSRIAAQNGDKIKATDILQGYKWTLEQEEAITIAANKYRREIAPQMIYNPDGVTADLDSILEYIEAEAQRAEAAEMPVPAVVLDYLQIIRGREREDDVAIIKRAMGSLKDFAIRHNTFVFVIMANNRASNRTGDVTQESGRDSSALEYGADIQLGLAYTLCLKKYGNKSKDELTPEEMKLVTLKITKGRWGGPGADVNLHFDGETMTYTQMAAEFLEEMEPQKKAGRRPQK